ncbi:MAG: N-acetylmuramoyl-L-alanine amidase [Fusobacterium sp. JB021]|nr:N-acetylmuramoyl-L-alanine amidase [Fusobacterium sp. JB020]MDP0492819.1 N-acetylmuramoyl-L-alanine amidase [Fusobacterium sp. JB021]MDP0506385.1 N-acetylmuramoyl-L-alanine amidase [Fusobacterium sp. JB019]
MKKKFLSLIIFFITFTFSFSTSIKNIRFNKYPSQIVFDMDKDSPNYHSDYDEYNRLLFLEIKNNNYNNFSLNNPLSKYIESIKQVNYNNSTGFFVNLKKNIFYRVSTRKNPYRVVVDLSKSKRNKQYTVVIDPGHGGKDPGAVGNGLREKDLVLSIGKYLRKELNKDFNVVMTRDTDEFITLQNRSKIANGLQANLFISLHINSSTSTKMNGMEIFYFSKKSSSYARKIAKFENSFAEKYGEDTKKIVQIVTDISYNNNKAESMKLAEKLNNDLSKRMKMKNRKIHGANFAVLRGVNCPGILIETGFIRNKSDSRKLKNRTNRKIIAKEIAKHVRKYFY